MNQYVEGTFTPTDTANWNPTTGSILVVMTRALPTVSAHPTPSTVYYGQTLADCTLSGGSASEKYKPLQETIKGFTDSPEAFVNFGKKNGYANCVDTVEDRGHQFGADLSADDEKALKAAIEDWKKNGTY